MSCWSWPAWQGGWASQSLIYSLSSQGQPSIPFIFSAVEDFIHILKGWTYSTSNDDSIGTKKKNTLKSYRFLTLQGGNNEPLWSLSLVVFFLDLLEARGLNFSTPSARKTPSPPVGDPPVPPYPKPVGETRAAREQNIGPQAPQPRSVSETSWILSVKN